MMRVVSILAIVSSRASSFNLVNNNNNKAPFRHIPPSVVGSSATARRNERILWMAENKDWDEILRDENEPRSRKDTISRDMLYNPRNVQRSTQTFRALSEANAPGVDVYGYGRDGSDSEGTFWYLGKVNCVSDVGIGKAVARQYDLICQHAANLRPLDLFAAVSNDELELWTTTLDSEMDVAYNRPSTIFTKIERSDDDISSIKNTHVGFLGEYYENGEEGFRTLRHPQTGAPCRPEIQRPADDAKPPEGSESTNSTRPLTDAELAQLQQALEKRGMTVNDLYEQQQQEKQQQQGKQS